MIAIIIGILALLLSIGIGLWIFFNNKKVTEETIIAHETIGASEAADKDREDLIKKSKEQIEKNKKVIEESKKVMDENNKTTNNNS
jgi:hypothetical protein